MKWSVWGASLAGLAVVFGAFGAHTLAGILTPERLVTFETAVRYQMYHALVLLFIGLAQRQWPARRRGLARSGALFLGGIVVFSGSLYLLVATDVRLLGAITPIGGVAFIAGWLLLAWTLSRPE